MEANGAWKVLSCGYIGGILFETFDYWKISQLTLLGDPAKSISFF